MEKADYGIDAPGLVQKFMFLGGGMVFLGLYLRHYGSAPILAGIGLALLLWGYSWVLTSLLMLLYARVGKFKLLARMLDLISWNGNETVLDVGTGRGLLMIGAAKRLTTGKAYGVDIWNAEDLSDNNIGNTLKNAEIEGVKDKVQVFNEDVQKLGFDDGTFDVILSNLTIHNIYNPEGREKACLEIVRVLKPGGTALISDFRHTKDYAKVFRDKGLKVETTGPLWWQSFPPLTIVKALK